MIDPDVRPAAATDAAALRSLETEARSTLTDRRGGERWLATHRAQAENWGSTIADLHVFAAHIDEVIVGYLVLNASTDVAVIDDVYVTPRARELGFGDALLEAGLSAAKVSGCSVLEGTSLPGDRETKNLYERAGIKARLITVSTAI